MVGEEEKVHLEEMGAMEESDMLGLQMQEQEVVGEDTMEAREAMEETRIVRIALGQSV